MPLLDYKPNALFLMKEEFLKHQDDLSCETAFLQWLANGTPVATTIPSSRAGSE
jgi:hypothetical protein